MTHLGERIRERRKQLGLSQARLAETAGVTASAISQIESGVIRTLKNETLAGMALALEMTVLELMADLQNESENSLSAEELRLLQAYRSLEPPLRDIAQKLIKALQ